MLPPITDNRFSTLVNAIVDSNVLYAVLRRCNRPPYLPRLQGHTYMDPFFALRVFLRRRQ